MPGDEELDDRGGRRGRLPAGLSLAVAALVLLEAVVAWASFPETGRLGALLAPVVLLLYLPEYPLLLLLHRFGVQPQDIGFPLVLPALALVLAGIAARRGARWLPALSVAIVLIALALYRLAG